MDRSGGGWKGQVLALEIIANKQKEKFDMAKTIKFNLILDNYPVRNIEGLQEHFSIEDMLKYFENGLLLRWLNVRGYDEQYTLVKNIDKSLEKKE